MNLLKKIGAWFSAHRPTKRRIIQLYAALLTNANLKGFGSGKIYQGDLKKICAPGLNCYSCPGASAACPLGALQNALASSGKTVPYYIFGIILLFGFLFGRWICGLLCPFGLIQDLLHKIKTPKIPKNRFTRILSYLKYVILVVFVVILPLIYAADALDFPLPAFCKYICPSGTLLGAGGLLANESNNTMMKMLGPLFTWKFCLLVFFIAGSIFLYRFFCRFFCPLGALYGLFNKISLLGMKVDEKSCTNCGLCTQKCGMDIRKVGDHECISCGDCVDVCPTNAITRKGPKILLPPNEIGGRTKGAQISTVESDELFPGTKPLPKKTKIARAVVAVLLLALLGGALYYYNFVDGRPSENNKPPSDETTVGATPSDTTAGDPDVTDESGEVTAPLPELGNEEGDLCYSVPLALCDGSGSISIDDFRGKITVVNFWGTWCGPCKHELIYEFPAITEAYGDKVEILAIHTSFGDSNDDVIAWVDENLPDDLNITLCRDNGESYYYQLVGEGASAWPATFVLDENGVILAALPYAVTFEGDLKPIIDVALAD
ncbi:MAG: 4Fe-4S binding protein [Clostridia bacterium]|nr:4Fe-4S binding protein [Clostridia bacterium]MBR2908336.1 4Fe-4S binding protein [Clostridia bacterium]